MQTIPYNLVVTYTKKELRKLLLDRRMLITDLDRSTRSKMICAKLMTLDIAGVQNLHYFSPIQSLGEVNILPFIESLKSESQNIALYSSQKIDGVWEIVNNDGEIASTDIQFDVIIVPMLGFDSVLQRIGYGGGYYDRLLSDQPHALTIGVCFENCRVDKLPKEEHDISLKHIYTEVKVYR